MKHASFPFVVVAGLAALRLSGCSGESGLRALDRAATPDDALPLFVTLQEQVDRDSARLLATRDGVRYFALQSDDARTTCLAVVPPGVDPEWQVGCGDARRSGEIVNMSSSKEQPSTILLGDDSDTGKDEPRWTKIADNLPILDPQKIATCDVVPRVTGQATPTLQGERFAGQIASSGATYGVSTCEKVCSSWG